MSNFYEPHTEFEERIADYVIQLDRIDSFVRRKEKRAARVQFEALLDDIQKYSDELSIPVDTMVVGAQLGVMSGGNIVRGRLPAALIGAGLGWLYGQHARREQRKLLEQLIFRASETAAGIEALEKRGVQL